MRLSLHLLLHRHFCSTKKLQYNAIKICTKKKEEVKRKMRKGKEKYITISILENEKTSR